MSSLLSSELHKVQVIIAGSSRSGNNYVFMFHSELDKCCFESSDFTAIVTK